MRRFIAALMVVAACLAPSTVFAQRTPDFSKASKGDLKQFTAYLIVSSGHLCAEVTDIRPLRHANTYEVTCIAYQGGAGTKAYIFNAATGVVFPQ